MTDLPRDHTFHAHQPEERDLGPDGGDGTTGAEGRVCGCLRCGRSTNAGGIEISAGSRVGGDWFVVDSAAISSVISTAVSYRCGTFPLDSHTTRKDIGGNGTVVNIRGREPQLAQASRSGRDPPRCEWHHGAVDTLSELVRRRYRSFLS
ncbi:hypothetical protein CMUS01_15377 [Colletotrichum musicola]|uniref:Uncharacterized protein n=1 Tax=Colletotrichum musicola TaxID=2175873 RepID=A0A8H6IXU0_9PEZI|nr:hypothetical protein CMUS01_15377 [Colletotrichum musicola]